MTTLTDREKALVEAVQEDILAITAGERHMSRNKVKDALRAYDPPKEKVYVLPTWVDFLNGKELGLGSVNFASEMRAAVGHTWVDKATYNAIREATAQDAE